MAGKKRGAGGCGARRRRSTVYTGMGGDVHTDLKPFIHRDHRGVSVFDFDKCYQNIGKITQGRNPPAIEEVEGNRSKSSDARWRAKIHQGYFLMGLQMDLHSSEVDHITVNGKQNRMSLLRAFINQVIQLEEQVSAIVTYDFDQFRQQIHAMELSSAQTTIKHVKRPKHEVYDCMSFDHRYHFKGLFDQARQMIVDCQADPEAKKTKKVTIKAQPTVSHELHHVRRVLEMRSSSQGVNYRDDDHDEEEEEEEEEEGEVEDSDHQNQEAIEMVIDEAQPVLQGEYELHDHEFGQGDEFRECTSSDPDWNPFDVSHIQVSQVREIESEEENNIQQKTMDMTHGNGMETAFSYGELIYDDLFSLIESPSETNFFSDIDI